MSEAPIDNLIRVVDGKLSLPPGNFKMTQPIDLGQLEGCLIEGAGRGYLKPNPRDGQVTRLIMEGDGPHFVGEVSRARVRNLTLVGGGFHVQPSRSLGTGWSVFEGLYLYQSKITLGSRELSANAGNFMFRDVMFNQSNVTMEDSQVVDVNFENIAVIRCFDEFLTVNGGGMVNIDKAYVIETQTLINVTGPGSKTGPENGTFNVTNVNYDAKWKNSNLNGPPCIIHDTHHYGSKGRQLNASRITFNRGTPGILCQWDGKMPWNVEQIQCRNVQ